MPQDKAGFYADENYKAENLNVEKEENKNTQTVSLGDVIFNKKNDVGKKTGEKHTHKYNVLEAAEMYLNSKPEESSNTKAKQENENLYPSQAKEDYENALERKIGTTLKLNTQHANLLRLNDVMQADWGWMEYFKNRGDLNNYNKFAEHYYNELVPQHITLLQALKLTEQQELRQDKIVQNLQERFQSAEDNYHKSVESTKDKLLPAEKISLAKTFVENLKSNFRYNVAFNKSETEALVNRVLKEKGIQSISSDLSTLMKVKQKIQDIGTPKQGTKQYDKLKVLKATVQLLEERIDTEIENQFNLEPTEKMRVELQKNRDFSKGNYTEAEKKFLQVIKEHPSYDKATFKSETKALVEKVFPEAKERANELNEPQKDTTISLSPTR